MYDMTQYHLYVSGPEVCSSVIYGIRPIVACLPAWFRFAQCLRRYRDTKLVFPHIANAGKYSTTFFVVLFSSLNSMHRGKITFVSYFLLIMDIILIDTSISFI